MRRLIGLSLLLLLVPFVASGQMTTYPSQNLVLENSQTVSTANAAAVKTLTAVTNYQHRVYGVSAFCSAGTATLTITDGGTTIWSTQSGAVSTSLYAVAWTPAPLTGARSSAVVITLSTCGSSNTGTLNVQADRY